MGSRNDTREAQVFLTQALKTRVLPVKATRLGTFTDRSDYAQTSAWSEPSPTSLPLEDWDIALDHRSPDAQWISDAATALRTSDIPVAFPTETVYGLGADATRSSAVRGIYAAKQRPADNPLIVHIASISQLRQLLTSSGSPTRDPIPEIYKPLIRRFWPGPLTIILPTPSNTPLAKEVTAGLSTFGVRMPRNLLALTLIKLSDRPIAAPSANASTKPSPTAAEHVLHDLSGRIETILDGGPCDVGVESTVVDGLSSPPAILRPGGISIDQLRQCAGWEGVVKGYADAASKGTDVPRAPGMKYRHYSPKAKVVLYEAGVPAPSPKELKALCTTSRRRIGLVRTRRWERVMARRFQDHELGEDVPGGVRVTKTVDAKLGGKALANGNSKEERSDCYQHQLSKGSPIRKMLDEEDTYAAAVAEKLTIAPDDWGMGGVEIWDMRIGPSVADVARGLFSALRDLDRKDVDAIVVEGIDTSKGDDVAAAVMNRLRKAAEVRIEE